MKIIQIKIIPNASRNEIEELDKSKLKIHLRAKAEDGKANMQLIELLTEHFGVRKSQIRILKGHKSREKIVEIL